MTILEAIDKLTDHGDLIISKDFVKLEIDRRSNGLDIKLLVEKTPTKQAGIEHSIFTCCIKLLKRLS